MLVDVQWFYILVSNIRYEIERVWEGHNYVLKYCCWVLMNQRAARRSQAVWVYNTDMHCSQKQQYNAITFPPVAAFLAALSMRQYCSTVLTIRTSCTTLKQCCSLHTLRTNEIKVNYYFWVLLKRKMGKLYRQHSTRLLKVPNIFCS